MSEYPVNYLEERITTYGGIKQQIETTIDFMSDYADQFDPIVFGVVKKHLQQALRQWSLLNRPIKEKW